MRDGLLMRYLPGGLGRTELADADVPAVLNDVFGADPALYIEAAEVRRKYLPASL